MTLNEPNSSEFTTSHAVLDGYLDGERRLQAVSGLRTYFCGTRYAGRRFENIAGRGDAASVANRITAADLVALPLLSIGLDRPQLVIDILETHAEEIEGLLSSIPADSDIGHVAWSALDESSPAQKLYSLLRSVHGVGPTTASKLLARKRRTSSRSTTTWCANGWAVTAGSGPVGGPGCARRTDSALSPTFAMRSAASPTSPRSASRMSRCG